MRTLNNQITQIISVDIELSKNVPKIHKILEVIESAELREIVKEEIKKMVRVYR